MADVQPNFENITFKTYAADGAYFGQLRPSFVDELYEVGTTAFENEVSDRPRIQIAHMMGSRDEFYDRLTNPGAAMEAGKLNAGQAFARPTVSVAFADFDKDTAKIVGYATSADNVSGRNKLERRAKQIMGTKNYRWLKTVVVLTEYQGQQIGTGLSVAALASATKRQPASAYTWPSEGVAGTKLVERLGMQKTGSQEVDVFGSPNGPTSQHRYAAPNAQDLLEKLVKRQAPTFALRLGRLAAYSYSDIKRAEADSLAFIASHQK